MPLFRRKPRLLPLQLPRLDGESWPDRSAVGRASFAASTLYQLGYREAFEPEAHDIADLLIAEVLPMLAIQAEPEDEPYLHRTFTSAAQIGAGIGLVERKVTKTEELSIDRDIGGALWVAVGDLPSMPAHQRRIALYLLQSGHYIARTGPGTITLLRATLGGENHLGAS